MCLSERVLIDHLSHPIVIILDAIDDAERSGQAVPMTNRAAPQMLLEFCSNVLVAGGLKERARGTNGVRAATYADIVATIPRTLGGEDTLKAARLVPRHIFRAVRMLDVVSPRPLTVSEFGRLRAAVPYLQALRSVAQGHHDAMMRGDPA
jgi:hypothetical protein